MYVVASHQFGEKLKHQVRNSVALGLLQLPKARKSTEYSSDFAPKRHSPFDMFFW